MDFNLESIRELRNEKRTLLSKLFHMRRTGLLISSASGKNEAGDLELMENIRNAKKEWVEANTNFEYVEDQEIVDYYTYKILASQIRYEYFLRKAKEKGFKV